MEPKVLAKLKAYCEKKGYDTDNDNWLGNAIFEDGQEVYEELHDERRHWDEYFVVKDYGGLLVGFVMARTTGDLSADEKGWEFDHESICEVEEYEETVTKYKTL